MDVIDGDPSPEKRGDKTTPPINLEDIMQTGGGRRGPEVPARHEHIGEGELRVRRRRADVERDEVVDDADCACGGVDALQMLDVCSGGGGGFFLRGGGRGAEKKGRGEEEDVHEAWGWLPEED